VTAPVAAAPVAAIPPEEAAAAGLSAGELASMLFAVDLLDHSTEATTEAALNAADVLSLGMNEWYNSRGIEQWAGRLADMITDFELSAARDADAGMAELVSLVTKKPFRPIGMGLRNIPQNIRKDVTPAGVFGRVADTYRFAQKQDDEAARALLKLPHDAPVPVLGVTPAEAAQSRLEGLVRHNLKLAQRDAANATLRAAADKGLIIGYRRILHPELARTGDCGMCIASSTRLYHSDHLLPLHPGCHCLPLPVTATSDPGGFINDSELARFYSDAGSNRVEDLRKTRYRVDENGEIGPVLAPHDEPIRTKREVARAERPIAKPKTDAQKLKTMGALSKDLITLHDRLQSELQAGLRDTKSWSPYLSRLTTRIRNLQRDMARVGR
jgi:hypothetical protein